MKLYCNPIFMTARSPLPEIHAFSILAARVLDIRIRSEGCNDPGRASPCGKAYIEVDGTDYSPQGRGYNVVVVDGETGNR